MSICSSLGDCFNTAVNSIEVITLAVGFIGAGFAGIKATNWYKGLRKSSKAKKAVDTIDSVVADLMRFANEFKAQNGGKLTQEASERLHTTAKTSILEQHPEIENHIETNLDEAIAESVERAKN